MSSSQSESTCPSTPRDEERVDLEYWMRAAERLIEAGEKGCVSRKEWIRWGEYFDTLPCVGEYFRHLLASKPRSTAISDGAKKAKRKRVELAPAVQEGVPVYAWGQWMLPCTVWWWQNNHPYLYVAWTVCQGV